MQIRFAESITLSTSVSDSKQDETFSECALGWGYPWNPLEPEKLISNFCHFFYSRESFCFETWSHATISVFVTKEEIYDSWI